MITFVHWKRGRKQMVSVQGDCPYKQSLCERWPNPVAWCNFCKQVMLSKHSMHPLPVPESVNLVAIWWIDDEEWNHRYSAWIENEESA